MNNNIINIINNLNSFNLYSAKIMLLVLISKKPIYYIIHQVFLIS